MNKQTTILYLVVLTLGIVHVANAQQESGDLQDKTGDVDGTTDESEGQQDDLQKEPVEAEEAPGDVDETTDESEGQQDRPQKEPVEAEKAPDVIEGEPPEPEGETDDVPEDPLETGSEVDSSTQEGTGSDVTSVEEEEPLEDDDEFVEEFEEDKEEGGWQPDISGFVKLDKRFLTSDAEIPMVDFYSKARLELKSWPTDDLLVVVSGEIRFYSMSGVASSSDLSNPGKQMPFDALPWEIYLKAHDLFAPGLDLSIGKQRITWGTADKLNPTDNLNPDDFSDIFDWGAKVPSTSALLSYTFPNDWSLATTP